MDAQCDIAIVGGGMVGISLALALQRALPDASIVLLEAMRQPRDSLDRLPQPSFDARSTAISRSSVAIFERVGLWATLAPHACPIETIHVSAQGRFGSALLHASDHDWPALGYVVENGVLGHSLLRLLLQSPVTLRDGLHVDAVQIGAEAVTLHLREQEARSEQLRCRLLVLADGTRSALREQLGIGVQQKDYRQHALIANIALKQAHASCAWERFTPTGPLAMLPLLASTADEHRAALVWTLPSDQISTYLELSDAHFLNRLQQAFGYRRGRLLRVGKRRGYALALTRSTEQVRRRVVVMGNAAHALHPVAGQGFNLALRDVDALAEHLAAAPEPLGDLAPLQRYLAGQAADQARTVALSDQLPPLFARRDPLSSVLRDMALASLDVFDAPKRRFTQVAAGVFPAAMEVNRV